MEISYLQKSLSYFTPSACPKIFPGLPLRRFHFFLPFHLLHRSRGAPRQNNNRNGRRGASKNREHSGRGGVEWEAAIFKKVDGFFVRRKQIQRCKRNGMASVVLVRPSVSTPNTHPSPSQTITHRKQILKK